MDIIDILLAKSMSQSATPDGTAAAAAQQALAAAQQASAAAAEAQEALSNVKTEEEIQEIADTEIKKLDVEPSIFVGNNLYHTAQVTVKYPDDTESSHNFFRIYQKTGTDPHQVMSQKAITEALEAKADKTYVDEQIAAIPAGSGDTINYNINLGPENAGNIVIIGPDGNIVAGDTSENAIIEALIKAGSYIAKDALGVEIDYQNKVITRTQDATLYSMGEDFNHYKMFGGRMRCNVADDGFINAFYGEEGYTDDGSNGQVMVYQPKFYYQRIPMKTEKNAVGKIIRKESLIISSVEQSGFKLHPIFIGENGEELEYVLLPAYEGSIVNNKLSSVADQKPTSNISITQAEQYARNRGTGWHITNMAAESANQMLEIVEFGSMNGQTSIESGLVSIPNVNNKNCASQTGSTSELGNGTGAAASTTNITNNTTNVYDTEGRRAISYRGMENPWGNIWRMIGGINIYGNGKLEGGVPYISTSFTYNTSSVENGYESVGFCLPSNYGWISAMGYGEEKYDWVFMPAECSSAANSVAPVGDNLWTNSNQNGLTQVSLGGSWGFGASAGPFYYACDNFITDSAQISYGASLMYIPRAGTIYTNNYNKWLALMGE